ncbi:hypothetical protein BGZ58_010131 [Dissophora ornata]|nr:hypothetical protein BGZ58_010131 [Dissophora ornata]
MSIPGLLSLRERGRRQTHILKDSLLLKMTKEYACATTFNYSSGSVVDMAFKSSTMKLAVANVTTQDFYNRPGNLLLCDFNKGLTKHIQGHEIQGAIADQRQTVTVNDIKLSHSERFFISGANDNKTMIWDAETGRHLNTVEDYRSPVNRIAIMESPKYGEDIFATCSGDGVGVVNIYSLGPEGQVLANNKQLTAPGGKRYVSSISFGYGHFWDCLAAGFEGTDNGQNSDGMLGQKSDGRRTWFQVSDINCYPQKRILPLIFTYRTNAGDDEQGDGIVRIFDVHRGKVVQSANSGHLDVNIVDVSPCENYVISCSHQNEIAVFDRRFLKPFLDDALHRFQHENKQDGDANAGITSALWWPEGRGTSESMFITSGGDGAVKLWDIRRATEDSEIWSFDANLGPIARMTCSPSLEHLIVGADTGAVSLFTLDHSIVSGYSDRPMALLTDPEEQ